MTSAAAPPSPDPDGPLAARLGLAAASALLATIALWEGYRATAYRDLAGVPTACWGDTNDVSPGRTYSRAECRARLERQALMHAEAVLRCTPRLAGRRDMLVAASSLAYNIGASRYCRSTAARRFNAGDLAGGCDAFLTWTRVKGRVVRGLVNRRRFERELCLSSLRFRGDARVRPAPQVEAQSGGLGDPKHDHAQHGGGAAQPGART